MTVEERFGKLDPMQYLSPTEPRLTVLSRPYVGYLAAALSVGFVLVLMSFGAEYWFTGIFFFVFGIGSVVVLGWLDKDLIPRLQFYETKPGIGWGKWLMWLGLAPVCMMLAFIIPGWLGVDVWRYEVVDWGYEPRETIVVFATTGVPVFGKVAFQMLAQFFVTAFGEEANRALIITTIHMFFRTTKPGPDGKPVAVEPTPAIKQARASLSILISTGVWVGWHTIWKFEPVYIMSLAIIGGWMYVVLIQSQDLFVTTAAHGISNMMAVLFIEGVLRPLGAS